MSSTNKTPNYDLSQFIGTDKPAWLGDYNNDMSKIDTGIKTASDAATAAEGKADTANTNIGSIEGLTTTDKTSVVAAVNEVNTRAIGAEGSATNANQVAQAANIKATELDTFLNINQFKTSLTISNPGGITLDNNRLHSAYNANGTLGKLYGRAQFIKTNNQNVTITISDTGLRPESEFIISDGAMLYTFQEGTGSLGYRYLETADIKIKTDGTAEIELPGWVYSSSSGITSYIRLIIQPYLIFARNFE